jgi:hypothetical protein
VLLAVYVAYAAALAAWVARDATARRVPPWPWLLATLLLGPVGAGLYLSRRPLRLGETRRGGEAWQAGRGIALASAGLALWLVLSGALVGAASGGVLPAWTMGGARFPVAVGLLGLAGGMALRRRDVVEEGPTGPLATEALERWRGGRPRASKDAPYECAECGDVVAAGAAFCPRCGAYPGQSG